MSINEIHENQKQAMHLFRIACVNWVKKEQPKINKAIAKLRTLNQ